MERLELLQRAIHSAKCRIYRINYDLNCHISLNHQKKAENQKELMEITVEALEKQIPKKVAEYKKDSYCCTMCGAIVYPTSPYCKHCGQALDWSDKK